MISCYYYRGIIKNGLDADGALPEPARNHIQKCPTCREIYESESRVIQELRAGAPEQSASPFLHAKIMSAIARSGRTTAGRPHRHRAAWAIGLATACLVVLTVFWMRQRAATDGAAARASRPSAPVSIDLSLGVKLPDGNQVRQWAGKLDEPLETEQKLVIGDAKTALNALADNFLPEQVRRSLFEQDKGS